MGEGQGQAVRVVDGQGPACCEGAAVGVRRVAEEDDAAGGEGQGGERGAGVVGVGFDVGGGGCQGLDEGAPVLWCVLALGS